MNADDFYTLVDRLVWELGAIGPGRLAENLSKAVSTGSTGSEIYQHVGHLIHGAVASGEIPAPLMPTAVRILQLAESHCGPFA